LNSKKTNRFATITAIINESRRQPKNQKWDIPVEKSKPIYFKLLYLID